jgi:hypothetical protein
MKLTKAETLEARYFEALPKPPPDGASFDLDAAKAGIRDAMTIVSEYRDLAYTLHDIAMLRNMHTMVEELQKCSGALQIMQAAQGQGSPRLHRPG